MIFIQKNKDYSLALDAYNAKVL